MKPFDFDAIVIGSGFGGSVMTCRLAEKGYRVCLLERGRQYGMHEFPRKMQDIKTKLLWDPEDHLFGFIEFNTYSKSDAYSVRASGLGGGSLIYANVLFRMPEDFFDGWPGGINRQILDPYYDKVLETTEASPYPLNDDNPYYNDTPKTHLMKLASEKIKPESYALEPHKFSLPDLTVRFKGDFPGHQSRNKHNALQSSCIKCGECDIGCNILAKNSLDLNYIVRAQNEELMGNGSKAAEVRTEAEVIEITPLADKGYEVIYINPKNPDKKMKLTAEKVILSAGSIGSTGLLLKMKKYKKLQYLSGMLGEKWCGNGDLEGTIFYADHEGDPNNGPVITCAIEYNKMKPYDDGFKHGMVVQDAGFPVFMMWFFAGKFFSPFAFIQFIKMLFHIITIPVKRLLSFLRLYKYKWNVNPGNDIAKMIDGNKFIRKGLVLLAMGRDRNNGRIELNKEDRPIIKWKMKKSRLHYKRARKEMKKISKTIGGFFYDNPLTYLNKMIAVHPLGGCVMAESAKEGVVDTKGEVFGHKGLYVVDASIIPTSIGPNPSMTIAAMAEYIASQFPEK